MGVRAVRLDGADQYGAGAGWRGRRDAGEARFEVRGSRFEGKTATRHRYGAGGQWAVVLARSEAGGDACGGGGGAEGGLYGRGAGVGDELFELRESREARNRSEEHTSELQSPM